MQPGGRSCGDSGKEGHGIPDARLYDASAGDGLPVKGHMGTAEGKTCVRGMFTRGITGIALEKEIASIRAQFQNKAGGVG